MTRVTRVSGFTLIELLVVTGIIALISGLVLANNTRFGGKILLQNLAYDIALSIREAQIYGISVQRFNGSFGAAYGMHFQLQGGGAQGQDTYVLFADAVDVNGLYDAPGELVQSTTVSQGYHISDLCATPPQQAEMCGLPSLDVTFQRPEPDAYIRNPNYAGLNESARIIVSSPRGDISSITLEANGQIAVK